MFLQIPVLIQIQPLLLFTEKTELPVTPTFYSNTTFVIIHRKKVTGFKGGDFDSNTTFVIIHRDRISLRKPLPSSEASHD